MFVAYKIDDEERSTIVFAATESDAASIGAQELVSDEECVEVTRTPEYDQYAQFGHVPIKVLYNDYWWFECEHCQQRVSLADDEDEDGNPLTPVFEPKRLFCGKKCQDKFYTAIKARRKVRNQACQYLLDELPGIAIASCCGGGDYPISIWFTFPGGKHEVSWASDSPKTFLVTRLDLKAWEAYCALPREAKVLTPHEKKN
jgi:hypothetical protein